MLMGMKQILLIAAVLFMGSMMAMKEAQAMSCIDGSQPVQCFVNPCSASSQNCSRSCWPDYCGGCNALCTCESDSDCNPALEFCRPTTNVNVSTCVALSTEGSLCGGHVAHWAEMRCLPGLICLNIEHPGIADLPGICHKPCLSQADCSAGQLCLIDPQTQGSFCSDNRDIFYPPL